MKIRILIFSLIPHLLVSCGFPGAIIKYNRNVDTLRNDSLLRIVKYCSYFGLNYPNFKLDKETTLEFYNKGTINKRIEKGSNIRKHRSSRDGKYWVIVRSIKFNSLGNKIYTERVYVKQGKERKYMYNSRKLENQKIIKTKENQNSAVRKKTKIRFTKRQSL